MGQIMMLPVCWQWQKILSLIFVIWGFFRIFFPISCRRRRESKHSVFVLWILVIMSCFISSSSLLHFQATLFYVVRLIGSMIGRLMGENNHDESLCRPIWWQYNLSAHYLSNHVHGSATAPSHQGKHSLVVNTCTLCKKKKWGLGSNCTGFFHCDLVYEYECQKPLFLTSQWSDTVLQFGLCCPKPPLSPTSKI